MTSRTYCFQKIPATSLPAAATVTAAPLHYSTSCSVMTSPSALSWRLCACVAPTAPHFLTIGHRSPGNSPYISSILTRRLLSHATHPFSARWCLRSGAMVTARRGPTSRTTASPASSAMLLRGRFCTLGCSSHCTCFRWNHLSRRLIRSAAPPPLHPSSFTRRRIPLISPFSQPFSFSVHRTHQKVRQRKAVSSALPRIANASKTHFDS